MRRRANVDHRLAAVPNGELGFLFSLLPFRRVRWAIAMSSDHMSQTYRSPSCPGELTCDTEQAVLDVQGVRPSHRRHTSCEPRLRPVCKSTPTGFDTFAAINRGNSARAAAPRYIRRSDSAINLAQWYLPSIPPTTLWTSPCDLTMTSFGPPCDDHESN